MIEQSVHQDCLGKIESIMAKEKPDLVYGTLDMLILKALLYRLEAQGWIKAEWGVSDNNRKARYYKLTAAGRKQLSAEKEHWLRITKGIDLVLAGG
jgi:PadR family transcriptional regulator